MSVFDGIARASSLVPRNAAHQSAPNRFVQQQTACPACPRHVRPGDRRFPRMALSATPQPRAPAPSHPPGLAWTPRARIPCTPPPPPAAAARGGPAGGGSRRGRGPAGRPRCARGPWGGEGEAGGGWWARVGKGARCAWGVQAMRGEAGAFDALLVALRFGVAVRAGVAELSGARNPTHPTNAAHIATHIRHARGKTRRIRGPQLQERAHRGGAAAVGPEQRELPEVVPRPVGQHGRGGAVLVGRQLAGLDNVKGIALLTLRGGGARERAGRWAGGPVGGGWAGGRARGRAGRWAGGCRGGGGDGERAEF